MLSILNRSSGGGGTGEDGGDGGEAGGVVGGGGMRKILFSIKWISLCGENFTSSSSPPHGGEINGLFSGPLVPSFL